MMPQARMAGTVLSALKADPDLCDIPVIMVTMVPDRGIGLSLGAVDVVDQTHRPDAADGADAPLSSGATVGAGRRGRRRHPRDDAAHDRKNGPVGGAKPSTAARRSPGSASIRRRSMILLDLMMPEMDGFEFLDVLGARAEWREIPVIVITAKQLTRGGARSPVRQARR